MRSPTANLLVGVVIALELFVALLVIWYAPSGLRDMIYFAA